MSLHKSTIDQAVSSTLIEQDRFKQLFSDQLFHATTREYFEQIISDYIGKVDFMEVVRKYAGMEIDSRLFRSISYWFITIITTVITSTIAYLLGHYFFK
jgi:hypothetical protein